MGIYPPLDMRPRGEDPPLDMEPGIPTPLPLTACENITLSQLMLGEVKTNVTYGMIDSIKLNST